MTYRISTLMFILWGILATVTMVVELDSNPTSVGGSTGDFQEFANLAGNPDVVGIDSATIGNSAGGISGAVAGGWDFVKQAVGWMTFFARSLLLQSPIWEDWTQPIRYAIMLISIPYFLHVTTVFLSSASSMVGGIAGRLLP